MSDDFVASGDMGSTDQLDSQVVAESEVDTLGEAETNSGSAAHGRAASWPVFSSVPDGSAWPGSTNSRESHRPRLRICTSRNGRRFPSDPRPVRWPACWRAGH